MDEFCNTSDSHVTKNNQISITDLLIGDLLGFHSVYSLQDHTHTQNSRQFQHFKPDPFIGPQEFIVGYSKAPKHPQSSARPICHSHALTSMGREPATIRIAAYI